MKRIAVLLNPACGKGKAPLLWRRLLCDFPKSTAEMTLFVSRRAGETETLTRQIVREGFDRILVLGGDGTLFEAVNGCADSSGNLPESVPAIATLPAGSSCDFLRNFPVSYRPDFVLTALQNSSPTYLDLLRLEFHGEAETRHRLCLNAASFGLSGEAAHTAGKRFSRLPPSAGYLSGFFLHLLRFRSMESIITVDGKPWYQGSLWNLFLCNGRFSGGGMLWAPQASLEDGKADLLAICPIRRHRVPGYVPRIFDGTLHRIEEARTVRALKVDVLLDRSVRAELDGELFCFRSLKMKMLPKTLPWILPALPSSSAALSENKTK